MSSILICGSFAYDTIMVFHDKFAHHILPDKVHILNVSFMVPDLRREYGGCAGNIAYGLKLLGGRPVPMGTVGKDFTPYFDWMDKHHINHDHIKVIHQTYTAQAYITTDLDDNQITAFHPGAMNFSHETNVSDAKNIKLGIISPDGRYGMIQHAAQLSEANIPFIFDPGQSMPMYNGKELLQFVEQARWITLNDYESQLMQERTGLSPHELAEHVEALIITLGPNGSHIYTKQKRIEIPAVKPDAVIDPTGCGDAYRAGLLYGLANDMDWETTGRIASLMGAIKIASPGTQNYHFTHAEFKDTFKQAFDRAL